MLLCGIEVAFAQQPQAAAESRLFQPEVDGAPQRFQPPRYGHPPTFGASTSGFDSTNRRSARRERENARRREASQALAAQPLAARVPDRTVAPVFQQPAPIASARAQAQAQAQGGLTPRPVRRAIVEDDPFAPVGIRAGSFILRPAIEVNGGYDSNPPRAHNPTGSSFQSATGELNVRSDWSRHAFDANVKGKYIWYNTLSNFNRPEVDLNARARIDISRQTRADLEAYYRLQADNPSDPNLPQGIIKPPLNSQTGASAGLTHRFNRLEVSAKGQFDRTSYDDAELNNGGVLSLKDRNYDQYRGLLRAGYEVYPGVTPFVEGGLDRRVHDLEYDFSGVQRDSRGRVIRVGSTFELTRQLVGEASVGYMHRDYEDPTLGKVHGLIYDAALTYYATPLTTLKLLANSRIDESIMPGVSGAFTREVGLQLDHSFRRWLIGTLKFAYGHDIYDGSPRADDRYSVSAGLTYKLTREVHLKGEFRREWLRSNAPGVDYTANIAMVGLRLQR